MPSFPSLSKDPSWPMDPDGEIEDSTIRSPFEGGYELTRPRFTRDRRKWGVRYVMLSSSDASTLRTFEKTTVRGGADSFTWTHPTTSTSYTVRFAGPIRFTLVPPGTGKYNAEFTLREV